MSAMTSTAVATEADFKVADLSLAEFGRKEIILAEHEMPGLMSIRARVCRRAAAERRAHHRLAAHDDPDGRADRDADRARRRGALVQLQHLLHAGPRRGGCRRRPGRHARGPAGRSRLRVEGRDARGVLVVHRAGAQLARAGEDGSIRAEHDPRRWRRRDVARAQGHRVREGRRRPRPLDGASQRSSR